MTDEDGVQERYRPTKRNLVRRLSCPRPMSTHPNNPFLQKREIKAFRHGVRPGDRRVFYCMSLSAPPFNIVDAHFTPDR